MGCSKGFGPLKLCRVVIVSLQHRYWGNTPGKPDVLLLHGLLGSSRNWQGVGNKLSRYCNVAALDQRNHGTSPHHSSMTYPSLVADVVAWLDAMEIGQIHLVGHSMGGKVCMYLACRYPERVSSLTVVDIAPRAYPPRWEKEFAAMQRMPVQHFTRRSEAEDWLKEEVRDWAFRKFLVSNLEREEAGGFRWIVNLDILQAALPNLFHQVPDDGQRYAGPVLYMRGSESRFVTEGDYAMIRAFFPAVQLKTIPEAGHNVHFDQADLFVQSLQNHIRAVDQRPESSVQSPKS
ncbi:MAG: alpha/beta fold hydrolase [Puniceicoccaceae bacterium]